MKMELIVKYSRKEMDRVSRMSPEALHLAVLEAGSMPRLLYHVN